MNGKNINGYTLKQQLGVGGMAEVWLAENKIGKKAAVKILLPKLCNDENVTARFLTEAKVMVDLNHPNIRQVYDYGDIDGRPAIIMEYLDGDDLKSRIKRGQRFSEAEYEHWWNQLVDALNYTHKRGIVHRDIKPGNIFVDRDSNIKLLDFGIAKVRESISSTQTGQKLGTLMYMSPEQVKDSKHIDYRTDVYSLAVTFVHLLTGRKPYDSDTSSDFEISEQIVYKHLDLSGLPDKWRNFLTPYLAKEPEDRPALRYFDTEAKEMPADDEGTMVEGMTSAPTPENSQSTPQNYYHKPDSQSLTPKETPQNTSTDQPKNKKGLWIGLGAAVVAAIVTLVLLLGNNGKKIYEEAKPLYDAKNYTEAFPLMYKAAEKGHARAQFYVGRMYNIGLGVEQDYDKAMEWYLKSYKQGDEKAMNNIGYMYKFGEGVTQDYHEAMRWYQMAADHGNAMSMHNIGRLYEEGEGVPQDYNEAVRWYMKSAELNEPLGQFALGVCYYFGNGVNQDYTQAVKWTRAAADQGNSDAKRNMGLFYQYGNGVEQDYGEAMKWYLEAAEEDDLYAQCNIGDFYYHGYGVEEDYVEAVKWYQKAAENGYAGAQYSLGYCYSYGQGVEENAEEAAKWYRKAADQGHGDAQVNLGVAYQYGKGVEQSYEEAVKWYRMAADQGNSGGEYNMGLMYDYGYGVKQSDSEAISWYRKCAEHGDYRGQYQLGMKYALGEGVSIDYNEARKWLKLAADQGYYSAQSALDILNDM